MHMPLNIYLQAKHQMYVDRLQLIGQRMRRNKIFQSNTQVLGGTSDGPTAQLTDLQSLRGCVGVSRIVMGTLARGDDGKRMVLEDASGSLPLDISAAQTTDGFFTGA